MTDGNVFSRKVHFRVPKFQLVSNAVAALFDDLGCVTAGTRAQCVQMAEAQPFGAPRAGPSRPQSAHTAVRCAGLPGATLKTFLLCSFLLGCASPVLAADVGVTVTVGQPGFYGRIDVGSFPRPVILYPQPVVIVPARVAVVAEPVYLRVAPGHAKNWAKHCSRYDACGQRVYFVQDSWYRDVYVPAYRDRGGPGYDHGNRGRGNHEHEGRHEGKYKDKHKDKHDKHKGKDKD